jgi:nucleoid-associated protein YgaU
MRRTDLVTPFALGPSLTSRRSTGFLRLVSPAILFTSCAILFAAQCHAQGNDQDVAAAARQERARKEAQQKKSRHVYTEEDLHRVQILTPEDHAQVEAKKNQQAPPAVAEKSEQALDADSLPPDAPLGDVARYFRQQKQAQKLQQSADFHLPFAAAPVLASPKPPVLASPEPRLLALPKPSVFVSPKPLVQLVQPRSPYISNPPAPHFAPYRPLVKRSPFERPKFFAPEPAITSPARPATDRKLRAPTRPTIEPELVAPTRPPAEHTFAAPSVPATNHKIVAPTRPLAAPRSAAKPLITPHSPSKRNAITVKPGDSLWRLAKQNLGSGLRWRELLSANPGILDPNRIFAGSQLFLPPAISFRATTRSSHPSHSHRLLAPT